MSKFKKAAGIVLAVIMAMSLCMSLSINSFADDGGTITVTNTVAGEEYNIYKMFDMTYNSSTKSYSYTVVSEWADFFATGAVGANYVTLDSNGQVSAWIGGNTSTGDVAATFAKYALAYAQDNGVSALATKTAASDTVVFSGLDYGYYLIDSSLGSLCILDSNEVSVEIKEKNPTPTVKKEVKEDSTGDYGESNTADIGETVSFKVEISNAYNSSNLVLHDTMSAGLTLNASSFSIYVGTSQATDPAYVDSTYYTISTPTAPDTKLSDGCTFEIAFTDEFTQTYLTGASQIVTVEYTATVNENAVIASTGNTNEATLSYGNDAESKSDETITYVYEIYVFKYYVDSTTSEEVLLAGAEFILYRVVGSTTYYAVVDTSTNKITGWTTTEGDATTLTSTGSDFIKVLGLDAGTYYLKETKAPDGYSLLANPVSFTIAQDGTKTGTSSVALDQNSSSYDAVKIENGKGTELPSTGGMGTKIFYTVGGLLVVCAGVLLITKRRMGK